MARRSLEENLELLEELRSAEPAKARPEVEKLLGTEEQLRGGARGEVAAELGSKELSR